MGHFTMREMILKKQSHTSIIVLILQNPWKEPKDHQQCLGYTSGTTILNRCSLLYFYIRATLGSYKNIFFLLQQLLFCVSLCLSTFLGFCYRISECHLYIWNSSDWFCRLVLVILSNKCMSRLSNLSRIILSKLVSSNSTSCLYGCFIGGL